MAEYLRDRGFLKGVDISNWQPNINYRALKNAGVEIAIIKATEANYYKDPYMEKHYNGCKSVGIKVGFYHFFRCNVDAKAQAQYFVNYIQGKSYDVKLVLDIETTEGQSGNTITTMARTFLEEVQRLTGTQPMIYTYTSFANSCLDGSLSVYPKWIAQYSPLNPNPCSLCDSNGWDGFQFASDGLIANSGYTNLDINEFKPSVYLDGKTVSTSGGNVQVQQTSQVKTSREWSNQYDVQILELQKILNAKGKGFNLVEDGIMGENTYRALCNYTFDLGDRGELTKWVQHRLNSMGFNAGYEDGYAEQPTVDAIHRFQASAGVDQGYLGGSDYYWLCKSPVSGSQPSATNNSSNVNLHLRDLQSAYNHDYGCSILVDGIRGQQVEDMLNRLCLSVGSKGQCVGWLQCRIGSNIDDIFGNNTKNAVMNFQRNNGLTVDGIAGKNTFNKLLEIYK